MRFASSTGTQVLVFSRTLHFPLTNMLAGNLDDTKQWYGIFLVLRAEVPRKNEHECPVSQDKAGLDKSVGGIALRNTQWRFWIR